MRGRGSTSNLGFNNSNGEYADPRYRQHELSKSRGFSNGTGGKASIGEQFNHSNKYTTTISMNRDAQGTHGRASGLSGLNQLNKPGNKENKLGYDETIDPRYRNRDVYGGRSSGLRGSIKSSEFKGPDGRNGPGNHGNPGEMREFGELNRMGGFSGPGRTGAHVGPGVPGGPDGLGRSNGLNSKKRRGFRGKGRRDFIFKKIKGQRHFKFNPFDASSWSQSGEKNFQESELPVNEFTKEEFVELRENNTEASALEQLKELATEITSSNKQIISNNSRACLICCNNYTKPSYKLGVGPINDSVTVAANHKYMGYNVFFLHNPKSTLFLECFRLFLQKTTDYLTIYYTGHGSSVADAHSDEDDGKDEVMIFDDTYVIDDKLSEILTKNANGKTKVILINDCCHSGTMYDIPTDMDRASKLPANVICLSAADDDETAKQGQQNSND